MNLDFSKIPLDDEKPKVFDIRYWLEVYESESDFVRGLNERWLKKYNLHSWHLSSYGKYVALYSYEHWYEKPEE